MAAYRLKNKISIHCNAEKMRSLLFETLSGIGLHPVLVTVYIYIVVVVVYYIGHMYIE